MFKFLKEKLKNAISKISKKIEEEPQVVEPIKEPVEKPQIKEEIKTEKPKKVKEEKFLEKVSIEEKPVDELFWELEKVLLENNVAVEVIEKIKDSLKVDLVNQPLARGEIVEIIQKSLRNNIEELFKYPDFDLIKEAKKKKPYVIVFVGINGSGKTTTIAKMAYMLKENGFSCVLGAADSFRASAIEQLEEWGGKLKVKVIKHDYGSDPAAIAFDTIKHAEAKKIDVVLIDTAGRMHSNTDLINEMRKIIKVAKPDLKLFIGEAITGNDCIDQARSFNDAIDIDGVILSKQDVDEKGGTAISISYVIDKPILYWGTGQNLQDLEKFDKNKIIRGLGLDEE